MKTFTYKGEKASAISFPLGGIGTGCLGLSGEGRLIDWEIGGMPSKGSLNGLSHFAVRAESMGEVLDARVLHGDLPPPYMGRHSRERYTGFGFGPEAGLMAGMPHFRDTTFEAYFPFARIRFLDRQFPGKAALTAFNPFIPLNEKDSGLPAALFEVELANTHEGEVTYTVCLSVANPFAGEARNVAAPNGRGGGGAVTLQGRADPVAGCRCGDGKGAPTGIPLGDLTLATDCEDVRVTPYWYRGRWFDSLHVFWDGFSKGATPPERAYGPGSGDHASVEAAVRLSPGERKAVRFALAWHVPYVSAYWKGGGGGGPDDPGQGRWKNHYATVFRNSSETAAYCLANWRRLYDESALFNRTLFESTLPEPVLDAVSANLAVLKSPSCLRLEDGTFYGFEGCHCHEGCCPGSCTHVYNYAYALPYLFPRLERSMRTADYRHNMRGDGAMSFRIELPLGSDRSGFRPCVDGQMGGVVKVYRDWLISGDTDWLRSIWPGVRKSLEFAWAETNEDAWDPGRSGVITGRQHHTLDMELFGPNSWLTGLYLAALKAASCIAAALGEDALAAEYMVIFGKGKAWVDEHLFNGEYYFHEIDLNDRSILERHGEGASLHGDDAVSAYWNEEAGEVKYQIGEGSSIDQVVAQWHANICGLGEVFDRGKVRKALESIYKYNYKGNIRNVTNPNRVFCLNDESGAVICDWPEGRRVPAIPVVYASETMEGFQYQAAAHMVQEGMADKGLRLVKSVRDKYDGHKRNPWNEFECGSNYARSMASYSLLLAYSGFAYSAPEMAMGFSPISEDGYSSYFWSTETGWGGYQSSAGEAVLTVCYGYLELKRLRLGQFAGRCVGAAYVTDRLVGCSFEGDTLTFSNKLHIKDGLFLKAYFE